jgi:hypothetical protein
MKTALPPEAVAAKMLAIKQVLATFLSHLREVTNQQCLRTRGQTVAKVFFCLLNANCHLECQPSLGDDATASLNNSGFNHFRWWRGIGPRCIRG